MQNEEFCSGSLPYSDLYLSLQRSIDVRSVYSFNILIPCEAAYFIVYAVPPVSLY